MWLSYLDYSMEKMILYALQFHFDLFLKNDENWDKQQGNKLLK